MNPQSLVSASAVVCPDIDPSSETVKKRGQYHRCNVEATRKLNLRGDRPTGYSVVYETAGTRELDWLFGLSGTPADDVLADKMTRPLRWMEQLEVKIAMDHFVHLARTYGRFVGVPRAEVESVSRGRVLD